MITFNHFLTIKGFNDYDYELPANVARSSSSSLWWNRRGRVFSLTHGKQLKEIWQLRSQVIPRSL